jgi:hypothetical protein
VIAQVPQQGRVPRGTTVTIVVGIPNNNG